MQISKCDRCNEVIDKNNENFCDIISKAYKRIVEEMSNDYPSLNLRSGETQLDLCPNCQKNLDDWFRFGRKLANVVEQVPPDEIVRNGIHYKKCDEVKANDT